MWSRMVPVLTASALLASALPVSAQGYRPLDPYGPPPGSWGGYAGGFLGGTHVGASPARVPRPTQIVPAPWSYGTYGIPTVSGIPSAPTGRPILTVINARGPNPASRRRDARAADDGLAGIRVIEVRVPRR